MNGLDRNMMRFYAATAQMAPLAVMLDAYMDPVLDALYAVEPYAYSRYIQDDDVQDDLVDYVDHVARYLIEMRFATLQRARQGNLTDSLMDTLINRVELARRGVVQTKNVMAERHRLVYERAQEIGDKAVDATPTEETDPKPVNKD